MTDQIEPRACKCGRPLKDRFNSSGNCSQACDRTYGTKSKVVMKGKELPFDPTEAQYVSPRWKRMYADPGYM